MHGYGIIKLIACETNLLWPNHSVYFLLFIQAIAFLSMLFCSGIVVYYIVRQMFKRCSGEASYEVLPN